MKKTTRAKKYTINAKYTHSGEVLSPDGSMVAWCGQSNGRAVAKRIAKALNADAAQRATIRALRSKLAASERQRTALNDFVLGMADGYARRGETKREWAMRDVLAKVSELKRRKP